jgi:hypothetical protein
MPLTTLRAIRRDMSDDMEEPFVEYVTSGYFNALSSSTQSIVYVPTALFTNLWTAQDFWNQAHLFNADTGEERFIYDYDPETGALSVTPAFDTTISTSHQFEIHARTTATRKNRRINRMLDASYPDFYSIATKYIVIPEKTSEITYEQHLPDWEELLDVHLEPYRLLSGPFTAASVNQETQTITVEEDVEWATDEWENCSIAFISGPGDGQEVYCLGNGTNTIRYDDQKEGGTLLRDSSADSVVTEAIEGEPDAGTRFYIKQVRQNGEWMPLNRDLMPVDEPRLQSLRLSAWLQRHAGHVIRLRGMVPPQGLVTDEDETDVPSEFLVNAAVGRLSLRRMAKAPNAAVGTTQRLGAWDIEQSERWLRRQRFPRPAQMTFDLDPSRLTYRSVFD